ncbi:MAG: GWxTD domain-containing protein [Candidatus Krumholzibacteriota bacterium]|nr:GWxTD domain-containing protein [Candidatus Krumholzibacteriota bacterium]
MRVNRKKPLHYSRLFSLARGGLLWAVAAALSPAVLAQPRIMAVSAPFQLAVSQGIDDKNEPYLVVNTAIDYRRLVFLKKDDRYESRYRIMLDLMDKKGRSIRGEVWEKTETTFEYEVTRSSTSMSTTGKSFALGPGEYKIRVAIEVEHTSLKYERETEINIIGREKGVIGLSDPIFSVPLKIEAARKPPRGEIVFSSRSEPVKEEYRVIPEGIFADFDSWLGITCELVSPLPQDQGGQCLVSTRVTGTRGAVEFYNRHRIILDETGQAVLCLQLNVDDLALGYHKIAITAEVPGSDRRASVNGRFLVLLNRGMLFEHFDQMYKLLSYFSTEEELAALKDAPPGERMEAWFEFWDARDPTRRDGMNENLSEFLRRLKYTLEHFTFARPGWDSDMGRIYIKYGEPDKIQDRSGSQSSFGRSFQLWYYYSAGIVFIFEESVGTGLYRLVTTRTI